MGGQSALAQETDGADRMRLTDEQVAQYWEQGYLLVGGLVSAVRLAAYERRFIALASGKAVPCPDMGIMRDVMVVRGAASPATALDAVNKLFNFEDDPELYGYALEPALLMAVRSLIGEDIFSVSTNFFNKPPGLDGRHPLHQDLRYFSLRPADSIVAVWTACTDTNRQNGCLAVIPGSHKGGLLAHGDPDWQHVNAGFFGIQDIDLNRRRHVPMGQGDTLLFHPLLVHGSGRNRGNACRRAIAAHYAAANCRSPRPNWHLANPFRRID